MHGRDVPFYLQRLISIYSSSFKTIKELRFIVFEFCYPDMEMSPVCEWLCDMWQARVSGWCQGWDAGTRESVHSIQRSHSWPRAACWPVWPQPDTNMAKEFGCPTFPLTPPRLSCWPDGQGRPFTGTQAAILPGQRGGGTNAQLPDIATQ